MPGRSLIGNIALALALAAGAFCAQAQPARGTAGGAATRMASHYSALERQLEEALAGHDAATLEKLLDPQLRVRVIPADALDRDRWLASQPQRRAARIHEVDVQDLSDSAMVSFFLDVSLQRAPVRLVVDYWRNDRLVSRIEAPASGVAKALGANSRE